MHFLLSIVTQIFPLLCCTVETREHYINLESSSGSVGGLLTVALMGLNIIISRILENVNIKTVRVQI